jgi:alpha-beta hydrolase superfamily lysophospholipase
MSGARRVVRAWAMLRACAGLLLLAGLLAGCAPTLQEVGPPVQAATLSAEALTMSDGETLPLRRWLPASGTPRAVIVALHGFNDYAAAFEAPGRAWAAAGIATYAYDQRGFGATREPGIWPGGAVLIDDLRTAVRLIRARNPGVPLYLLGESMGGAVVMAAATSAEPPACDGLILVAPAVWVGQTQGPLQSAALWLATRLIPWMKFTGADLDIWPTDNMAVLRQMSRDPLVIKATRVDAINGLVDLMDRAYAAAARLRAPALILYGSEEQVIPADAVLAALHRLPPEPAAVRRIAVYPKGYHMLLRDLNAGIVRDDVLAWIENPAAPLPSGADQLARRILDSGADSLKPDDDPERSIAAVPAPRGSRGAILIVQPQAAPAGH